MGMPDLRSGVTVLEWFDFDIYIIKILQRYERENGKMENGKRKMENGKWKLENGKWKMENGK